MSVTMNVFALDAEGNSGDSLYSLGDVSRSRAAAVISANIERWLEQAEGSLSDEDFNEGVPRTIEIVIEEDGRAT